MSTSIRFIIIIIFLVGLNVGNCWKHTWEFIHNIQRLSAIFVVNAFDVIFNEITISKSDMAHQFQNEREDNHFHQKHVSQSVQYILLVWICVFFVNNLSIRSGSEIHLWTVRHEFHSTRWTFYTYDGTFGSQTSQMWRLRTGVNRSELKHFRNIHIDQWVPILDSNANEPCKIIVKHTPTN